MAVTAEYATEEYGGAPMLQVGLNIYTKQGWSIERLLARPEGGYLVVFTKVPDAYFEEIAEALNAHGPLSYGDGLIAVPQHMGEPQEPVYPPKMAYPQPEVPSSYPVGPVQTWPLEPTHPISGEGPGSVYFTGESFLLSLGDEPPTVNGEYEELCWSGRCSHTGLVGAEAKSRNVIGMLRHNFLIFVANAWEPEDDTGKAKEALYQLGALLGIEDYFDKAYPMYYSGCCSTFYAHSHLGEDVSGV